MGREIKYDRAVIVQFAAKLYAQARSMILGYMVLGFLLGAGAGLFIFNWTGSRPGVGELGFVGIIGMIIGYRIGTGRAFALRLQAQVALCQVEIEANTRAALVVHPMPHAPTSGHRAEVGA